MGINQTRPHLKVDDHDYLEKADVDDNNHSHPHPCPTVQSKLKRSSLREAIGHQAARSNCVGAQMVFSEVCQPNLSQERPVPAFLILPSCSVVPLAHEGAERSEVGPSCLEEYNPVSNILI